MSKLSESHYGLTFQDNPTDVTRQRVEDVRLKGFTVIEGAVDAERTAELRQGSVDLLARSQEILGVSRPLEELGEADQVRLPLALDRRFLDHVALNREVLAVVDAVLGGERGFYVFNQQNIVVNRPARKHNQAKWHRDYPYFGTVGDRPIGLSAIFCLDALTLENGGTVVLPYSHRNSTTPSDRFVEDNHVICTASAGSFLVIDSLLWHRTGQNASDATRIICNNMYANPLLKQQIDIPAALKREGSDYSDDDFLRVFLGYSSQVPASWHDFVSKRLERG